ncbi:MAG: polysaccharide deacetylase family protein [Eubacteriaceae bacterium]
MFIVFKKRHLFFIFFFIAITAGLILFYNNKYPAQEVKSDDAAIYVPIIMYHEIKTFKLGKDVISPEEFEGDLKYLKENNYHTITMTELINYVNNAGSLPENPIILTFDDGYLSTYKYAYPLLEKYDMKIVFSIIGKNTDEFTKVHDDNIDYSHVTWDQINEMLQSDKVEIQNHTYDLHYNYGKRFGILPNSYEPFESYEKALKDDINKLQYEIIAYTGKIPNTFAYPYGKSDKSSEDVLKKMRFKATLTCNQGINIITKDPACLFGLKRLIRSHGDCLQDILTKAYKTIKVKK